MNSGSGASTGGLSSATRQIEKSEESRERGGEEAAALWVALTQQLTSAQARASLPTSSGVNPPPSAWRPSAGDLTPGASRTAGAADAPPPPDAPERLVLRVDGGALGELEVTLEKKDGAMNVVIGMENKHLVSSVLPDAAQLRGALEAAGIHVQSLNVVPTSEVGTVLAQRRLSPSGQKPAAEQKAADQDPEADPKRTHKRLTLIG